MRPLLLLSALCALFLLPLSARAQQKITETAGGFSFSAPKGWTVKKVASSPYKIAHGPVANKFAPNINVVDENYIGDVDTYTRLNVDALKKQYPDAKVQPIASFTTASGIAAKRVTCIIKSGGVTVRTVQFFLPGKSGKKYVLTCAALAQDGAKHDALWSATAKTFKTL